MESRQPLFDLGYCYPEKNRSCLKLLRKTEDYVALYIFAGVIIGLTMIGNLFVVISVSHFKQLHTTTNFLIVSLAMADFLIGMFVMPLEFHLKIETCWYFSENVCIFYIIYVYFLNLLSIIHLVLISVDRYLAICHPFYYNTKMSGTKMWVAIALCWLLCFFYTLTRVLFTGGVIVTNICAGFCRFYHTNIWYLFNLILTFILPSTTIICLYGKVFIIARSHARAIKSMNEHSTDSKTRNIPNSSQRKAAMTLGIVVIVFLICWIPVYVFPIAVTSSSVLNYIIVDAFSWISQINSCMNPFIYALFYPWFQQSLKLMLTCKIFKPASSVMNLFVKK
ncbi:trace amine-associated receptor 13c-like [Erpetoichthys calabaricus]|uniref:trace amine-associated receptor 13c-like n=1 Tax=Erpetoichthys calabaricus TaxID=27687 RepID=UPI002234A077|nr:trace amine-associated receptor 13c-like [Erpetoichthys calabaricus]